jgi:hypothetical protein
MNEAWPEGRPSPSQARPSAQGWAWELTSPSPLKPDPAHHYRCGLDWDLQPIILRWLSQQHQTLMIFLSVLVIVSILLHTVDSRALFNTCTQDRLYLLVLSCCIRLCMGFVALMCSLNGHFCGGGSTSR